ncbi:FERM domain-containing protein 4A-like isoform X2 [Cottoperca gobio]|nr:FERM domain-containing protein 4A-like isoform X2 [Cottoperca gobio]XP_029283993.1 FERM domain-containing protein 4A-like isoform X2 [Cottoperca gobio]XP_029283994.1 FERM domain-containing protein 4A-like isoform X2 [Cottoperca gobio]XP_029283995.1 FERM domain-containing protein 4A-like isoform X2 [Cottoperca gobio]XP_029283996.1 FERM domain-containing protein 4A-like isoform X2 [Cottoperca gobio]XP_029283998.1 FERM domain-containing protein 4A-like isoform X2 [Cottoperca gobio]XP_02928399
MEVKGQLISAREPLTCPDRKQRERMAELQERRRGLQALLSTRLAELRRICLQEAELTGAVPGDFPLEAGERPPCVRRRGGASRQGNRKCRTEEEDSQRSKLKKTLFSGALRKHSDSENNTHHGKRTVHRGCHTDDTVRSESSSTSDSTGLDNEDGVSQCRPPPLIAGSPVEVFYLNKTRNSLHSRTDHPEHLQKPPPLTLPPSHPPPPPPPSSPAPPHALRTPRPPLIRWGRAGSG